MLMFKHTLYILFSIFFLVGCAPDRDVIEPTIILEGWIENGEHPVALLHYSMVMGEEYDSVSQLVMDKLITLGKVTVSSSNESAILIGGFDTAYIPPYKYTSSRLVGVEGETYTIDVEYDNKTVTAQTTIPAPVFFDSIKVQQSPYVDSIIHLTGYVTDTDPSRENYYVLFYRYRGDKQYQNCFLGLFSDQNADENHSISMPIYRNVSTSTLKLSDSDNKKGRYFKPWDKIDIKLATVDSIGYKFWSEFSALTMTSSIAFMPIYTNVYSNVEGGKGYWIGYGAKVYPLTLRRDTTIRYPH